jgi:hypothetical protein
VETLLVGAFGLPRWVLSPLARELDAPIVRTGLTVGCAEDETAKVLAAVDAARAPVTLVGHSRGGQLAKVAAVRRPDQVVRVVTIGTPRGIGPPDNPFISLIASALRHIPSPIGLDCATGECCAQFRHDLDAPVAAPWTAVWSRRDRIVPPDDLLTDGARQIEVDASHVGLVTSREGRDAIAKVVSG